VHGLDVTFGAAALFAIAALVMVAAFVRLPVRPADAAVAEDHGAELIELVDGEGFEWFDPDRVAWPAYRPRGLALRTVVATRRSAFWARRSPSGTERGPDTGRCVQTMGHMTDPI